MAHVTKTLRADTARAGNGSYHFTLVAEGAGLTARSTSTYHSQADAVSASSRMDGNADADVVERDDGFAVRITGSNLEALSDPYPDRGQAQAALEALTG